MPEVSEREHSEQVGNSLVDRADLAAIAAAFGHALRDAGLPVTPEHSARFASAVLLSDPKVLSELYWLARVSLVSHRDQLPVFDHMFDRMFRGVLDLTHLPGAMQERRDSGALPAMPPTGRHAPQGTAPQSHPGEGALITNATPGSADSAGESEESSLLAAASAQERLGARDFASVSPDELADIAMLVQQLPLALPMRRGRRTRRARRGRQLDLRATLRLCHRSGGDPVRLVRRARRPKPRKLVLLADVSGSMEPYARIYLHLLRGAVLALHAEAFVFATRLTRLSRPLAQGSADAAYQHVAAKASDWSGGTRLAHCLSAFVEGYGRRGMARGAVVVVVSDGWEIEDPRGVGVAMQRLARLAHHIIWVNPRQAAEGYEPLVGGMAAALPHVNTFVSGHSVDALTRVVQAIARA